MGYKDGDFDEDDYFPEELTEEQNLELFNEKNIREKEQLIDEMEFHRDQLKRNAENDREHTAAYYSVLDKLFDALIEKTRKTKLFDKLEDWWAYAYSISSDGGKVELQYYKWVQYDNEGEMRTGHIDQSFVVINVPCRLLTVEEYARLYRVETGTVRQWIRRGKIRTARKFGNEWRIPELTDVPQRGYRAGTYIWSEELTDVPECYEYLRQPAIATLSQDPDNTNLFHVTIGRKNSGYQRVDLSTQEREKLELFLIAHPMVNYLATSVAYG